MLPSAAQLGQAMDDLFVLEDWHSFGTDYDRTLMAWHANFEKSWPRFSAEYGERFYRMWRYYLLSCAGAISQPSNPALAVGALEGWNPRRMERRPLMDRNRSNLFDSWESYRKTCRELSHAMAKPGGRPGPPGEEDLEPLPYPQGSRSRKDSTSDASTGSSRSIRQARIAEVEGMTTFEDFADATLLKGLRPPVVPELKTITIGGAVSGLGIEASSFRYGLVHEMVEEMEILCGDGTIRICRPDNENADLFHAIPNSYGSLGYILRLRVKLLPASPFVKIIHQRFPDRMQFLSAMEAACAQSPHAPDFVEGVAFTPDDFVLTTARLTHDRGPVSDYKGMQIYYQSLRSRSEDLMTMRDFLWRWDPDWFWCSRSFGMQNPLLRRLLGRWMLRSSSYWKIQSLYRKWKIEERVHAIPQRPALAHRTLRTRDPGC